MSLLLGQVWQIQLLNTHDSAKQALAQASASAGVRKLTSVQDSPDAGISGAQQPKLAQCSAMQGRF